jgi:hypothetical protein
VKKPVESAYAGEPIWRYLRRDFQQRRALCRETAGLFEAPAKWVCK